MLFAISCPCMVGERKREEIVGERMWEKMKEKKWGRSGEEDVKVTMRNEERECVWREKWKGGDMERGKKKKKKRNH